MFQADAGIGVKNPSSTHSRQAGGGLSGVAVWFFMSARIPVRGEDEIFAIVDDEFEKAAMCFVWTLDVRGEPWTSFPNPDHPTVRTSIRLKAMVMLERVVSPWVIKNLNGNPLDCRRENLKKMTLKEARALDAKNFGPRELAKKVQKRCARKLFGRSKPEPKPPRPKIFP